MTTHLLFIQRSKEYLNYRSSNPGRLGKLGRNGREGLLSEHKEWWWSVNARGWGGVSTFLIGDKENCKSSKMIPVITRHRLITVFTGCGW